MLVGTAWALLGRICLKTFANCARMIATCNAPPKKPRKDWFAAFLEPLPRLALRTFRIYEANRVSTDDRSRLEAFHDPCEI